MSSEFLVLAYTGVGLVDAMVYLPLILTILKNPLEAIKSNNYYSWMWWSFSALIIVAYMAIVIRDWPAIFISTLNFIACFAIFTILTFYRAKGKKNLSREVL